MKDYASEAKYLIDDLDTLLKNVQKEITERRDELADIQQSIETYQGISSDTQRISEETKLRCSKDVADAEKNLAVLKTEKRHLETENAEAVTKKADLKLENARLADTNAKFKTYEEKAWKVLQAKESELLERERSIEQKESLKPNNKSLLPPVE